MPINDVHPGSNAQRLFGIGGRDLVYPVAAMKSWFATISNRNG